MAQQNNILSSYESGKADPHDVNALFDLLGIDISFLKDITGIASKVNELKESGGLSGLLGQFIGDQRGLFEKLADETTLGMLDATIATFQGIGSLVSEAIISQVYITDEMFLFTLMGLKSLGANINFSNQYIRRLCINKDLPKTLEWIDGLNNVTYDHTSMRKSDAFMAAGSGAINVAYYIMKRMNRERKAIEKTAASGREGMREKESILLIYNDFFHSVTKTLITHAYSNLTVPFLNKIMTEFRVLPSTFGESDTQFKNKLMFTSRDIDVMAPFFTDPETVTGELGKLLRDIEVDNTVKSIVPRNMNMKKIYVYLVNNGLFGNDKLIHNKLYERLSYPEINSVIQIFNKAGYHLLKSGLGKFAFDLVRSVHSSAYDYTRSVEKYLFDPSKLKYIRTEDIKELPAPATIPPGDLGYHRDEYPDTPTDEEGEIDIDIDTRTYEIVRVDDFGFSSSSLSEAIRRAVEKNLININQISFPAVEYDADGLAVDVERRFIILSSVDTVMSDDLLERMVSIDLVIKKMEEVEEINLTSGEEPLDAIELLEKEYPEKVGLLNESFTKIIKYNTREAYGFESLTDMYNFTNMMIDEYDNGGSPTLEYDEFVDAIKSSFSKGVEVLDIKSYMETFGVSIPEEEASEFRYPKDVIDEVKSYLYNNVGITVEKLKSQLIELDVDLGDNAPDNILLDIYRAYKKEEKNDMNGLLQALSATEFLKTVYDTIELPEGFESKIEKDVYPSKNIHSEVSEVDIDDVSDEEVRKWAYDREIKGMHYIIGFRDLIPGYDYSGENLDNG